MKTLTTLTVYGYQELRQVYQRYLMYSFSLAVSFMLTCFLGYQVIQSPISTENTGKKGESIEIDWTKWQPPIDPIQRGGIAAAILPNLGKGIPIAVPDAIVDTSREFASQKQLSDDANKSFAQIGDGLDGGTSVIAPEPIDPLPEVFTPFEKEPIPVLTPAPQYPDVPRRTGMEGNVTVKVLITKEGKAKKAILVKSDGELFVQPSIDAAMKWTFTPALMNGKPVPVWVSIPFRFRLTK